MTPDRWAQIVLAALGLAGTVAGIYGGGASSQHAAEGWCGDALAAQAAFYQERIDDLE